MSSRYAVFNLEELESRSVAIARVTVLDSTLNLLPEEQQPSGASAGESVPLGNTLTRVTVEKVFKSDGQIREGATYTIIEYYVTMQKHDGATLVVGHGNVFPMEVQVS
jgi:hypothetical protein